MQQSGKIKRLEVADFSTWPLLFPPLLVLGHIAYGEALIDAAKLVLCSWILAIMLKSAISEWRKIFIRDKIANL